MTFRSIDRTSTLDGMSNPALPESADLRDGDIVTIAGQAWPDGRLRTWQVRRGDGGALVLRALPANGYRHTTGRSRRAEARASE